MKKIIVKAAAKIGKLTAVKVARTPSRFGYHQPKEPEALKKIK